MAGPCTENTPAIHFGFNPPNLKANFIPSPDPDNAIKVNPNGAYALAQVSKFYSSSANNGLASPVAPGVTLSGFGVNIELDAYAYFGGPLASPYSVSKVDTMTYKNTTHHNQWVEWEFVMPQTTYHVRGGWDVKLGLSTSVAGAALIPPTSSLRLCSGVNTGDGTANPAYVESGATPLGITFPPTSWGGIGILQPGETLTLQRRMFLRVDARGKTTASPRNEVFTLLDPSTRLKVSTWA